jgi:hypothetical protein
MMPKTGPFKGLAFRAPTPEVEAMFMKSFNTTIDQYRAMLLSESTDHLVLANMDLDIGAPTVPGQYIGADLAYDKLLGKLADKKFAGVTADLRQNLLTYYDGRRPPVAHGKAKGFQDLSAKQLEKAEAAWVKVSAEVEQLRQYQIEAAATSQVFGDALASLPQ